MTRIAVFLLSLAAAGCIAPVSTRAKSSSPQPEPAKVVPKDEEVEPLPEGDAPEGPIAVAAGEFWMGAEKEARGHSPKRKVTLDGYEIDRKEITAEEYGACVSAKKCSMPRLGGACTFGHSEKSKHPINCVTWAQARDYCAYAGKRLPTEAEWERAARGTDARTFVWGETWPPPRGAGNFGDRAAQRFNAVWSPIENYDDSFATTAPTGSFSSTSPEGAQDLAGNVMEWTQDYWTDKIAKAPAKNPKGPPKGEERVVRGASYGHHRRVDIEITHRAGYREDTASEHIGFRCAK